MKCLVMLAAVALLIQAAHADVPEGFAEPAFAIPDSVRISDAESGISIAISHDIVWETAYYLSNKKWKPLAFEEAEANAAGWIMGPVIARLRIPVQDILNERRIAVLVYGCNRSYGAWNCPKDFMGNPAWELGIADNAEFQPADIIFYKAHMNQLAKDASYLSNHDLASVVYIKAHWPSIEPQKGAFNFSQLDSLIDVWNSAGKKVLLRVNPYGQANGNDETPQWLLDSVPVIEFEDDKRGIVRIPRVWDSAFLAEYEMFLDALAEKYGSDQRVAYVQAGIGHIGFTTAQPSKEGSSAFLNEGWTLELWENYAKAVIDIYSRKFRQKQLVLVMSGIFLRDYLLQGNIDAGKRIAEYAALKNFMISFNGLEPVWQDFERTGVPGIAGYLASLNLSGMRMAFGDDWPLYGQTGSTYRNESAFVYSLDNVIELWEQSNRSYRVSLVLLADDLAASQPGNARFNQAVRDATTNFVNYVG